MDFVRILSGSFIMGCSPADTECFPEEKPEHRVAISKPFELGKYQVTQAEYEAVMGANPSSFVGPALPVDGVSWFDAQKFCDALNKKKDGHQYRLPSEAEWEYAARAGSTSSRYGLLDEVAWFRDNSEGAIRLARRNRMRSACMTRWATSGNGWRTGTEWITTRTARNLIPRAL